ncbi:unnamed protein product [Paramecium sonneborni]|uniref:P-type ATPase N-terminal domain-containing protein n=1 Tax=Paramecium sonneborni TaxID=65129 RepID=A0A8S1RUN6_9CILI|nr:unnamed protein product [Paramecium sonneborni]
MITLKFQTFVNSKNVIYFLLFNFASHYTTINLIIFKLVNSNTIRKLKFIFILKRTSIFYFQHFFLLKNLICKGSIRSKVNNIKFHINRKSVIYQQIIVHLQLILNLQFKLNNLIINILQQLYLQENQLVLINRLQEMEQLLKEHAHQLEQVIMLRDLLLLKREQKIKVLFMKKDQQKCLYVLHHLQMQLKNGTNHKVVQGGRFDNSGQEPLKQQLIEPQEPEIQTLGFFKKIKNQFNDLLKPSDKEVEQRIIYLNGKVYPQINMPNIVKNQKYNILSFVSMVLYKQFRYFFNLIFLFITLSQFVPLLKGGFLFSYVAPLAFVLRHMMIFKGIQKIMKQFHMNIHKKRIKQHNSKVVNQKQEIQQKYMLIKGYKQFQYNYLSQRQVVVKVREKHCHQKYTLVQYLFSFRQNISCCNLYWKRMQICIKFKRTQNMNQINQQNYYVCFQFVQHLLLYQAVNLMNGCFNYLYMFYYQVQLFLYLQEQIQIFLNFTFLIVFQMIKILMDHLHNA